MMPRLYLLLVLSLSVPVGAGVSALALLSGGLEFAHKTGGFFQARLLASRNSPGLCALTSWPAHLR